MKTNDNNSSNSSSIIINNCNATHEIICVHTNARLWTYQRKEREKKMRQSFNNNNVWQSNSVYNHKSKFWLNGVEREQEIEKERNAVDVVSCLGHFFSFFSWIEHGARELGRKRKRARERRNTSNRPRSQIKSRQIKYRVIKCIRIKDEWK